MDTNEHEFLTTKHTKHTKLPRRRGRQYAKTFVVNYGMLNAENSNGLRRLGGCYRFARCKGCHANA